MALDKFQPYLFVSAGEQSNKYLTPVISPNGIARFQAQRSQSLTGLTVRIDPIQEGTGDPSPTNIRPISGRTGLTVTRAGKNLLKPQMAQRTSSIVALGQSDTTSFGTFLKAGTYTISVQSSKSFAFYYRAENGTESVHVGGYNVTSATFTLTEDLRIRLYVYLNAGLSVSDISNPQLELGSTATAYEPYKGATYPVTWETEAGSVYGGTLDVVSGVLTVTHAAVDMGTLNYTYDSTGGRFYTSVSGKKNEASDSEMMLAISSMYKPMTATAFQSNPTNGTMRGATTGDYVYFRNNEYTDAASFKTAMAGQTLCYELATPQTYQLTGAEVRTLAGFNQIYSDAGPVIGIKF